MCKVCVINHPDDYQYEPSVISTCCISDCDGMTKIHSDIHMILRERSLSDMISPSQFRQIVDDLTRDSRGSVDDGLTDDQRFETIIGRRLTEFTDVYQFTKYLDSHTDEVKASYEKYQKCLSDRKRLLDSIKPSKSSNS